MENFRKKRQKPYKLYNHNNNMETEIKQIFNELELLRKDVSEIKEALLTKKTGRGIKAKEIFGLARGWNEPTQKIKDEMRKGWE